MVWCLLWAVSNRTFKWFLNEKYWTLNLLDNDAMANTSSLLKFVKAIAALTHHVLTNITLLFQFNPYSQHFLHSFSIVILSKVHFIALITPHQWDYDNDTSYINDRSQKRLFMIKPISKYKYKYWLVKFNTQSNKVFFRVSFSLRSRPIFLCRFSHLFLL